jgi:hypothetical protein
LHIGEGYEDYGGLGYNDSGSIGEEYAVTQYLRNTVNRINSNLRVYDIRFVVASGEMTDSSERSEFEKAKAILDGLQVPYIPGIGNHDGWPYIRTPDGGYQEASSPCGDLGFQETFQPIFNSLSLALANWEKPPTPCWDPETGTTSYFQNCAWDYEGYHFICLDFVTRHHTPTDEPGVGPNADLHDFPGGTWQWFTHHFDKYWATHSNEIDKTFIFPDFWIKKCPGSLIKDCCFTQRERNKIESYILGNGYESDIWGFFVGQHHFNQVDTWNEMHHVATAAVKDGRNAIRVVQIYGDGTIDASVLI